MIASDFGSGTLGLTVTWARFVCLFALITAIVNAGVLVWRLRTRHAAVWDRLGLSAILPWRQRWLSKEAKSFMKHPDYRQLEDPLIGVLWWVGRILNILIIAGSLWVFVGANLARAL